MSVAGIFPSVASAQGRSNMAEFRARCAGLTAADLSGAEQFHAWSVEHYRDFWRTLLEWSELAWEGSSDVVSTSDDVESAVFFPDVRLNYVENLLRPLPSVSDESVALTSVHGDGSTEDLTRGALRRRVQAATATLAGDGLIAGNRVAVIAANNPRATVATLAAASLGAAVATAMSNMGRTALLGRLAQVEPQVLVLDRSGAPQWSGEPGDDLHALVDRLPSLRSVLILDGGPLPRLGGLRVARLKTDIDATQSQLPAWPRLPFNHPLFVLFSSGTSGTPKAMVHGQGGSLIEHIKEFRLHMDMGPGDTYFHHTTTAWMVWHRQLSALAVGARIVQYDGPVRGPETLWRIVADQHVSIFGISAAYLQLCEDGGYRPGDEVDLSRLRVVLGSGTVVHDWQYDWFADAVGPMPLTSMSGGTDLIGSFVLGHPDLPVQRGRIQTRGLGMDVAAVDEKGEELVGMVGELVCRNPFPSRPVAFLRDPDGRRLHDAYYDAYPGMWKHGDLIDFAADGSSCVHGRSDGILNIDGVRIGPAEIHAVIRGVPDVVDSMAVEQRDPDGRGRNRLVLLVVLRDGAALDVELSQLLRSRLHREASSAHVPSVILAVPALPETHSGKPSVRAAQDVLNGDPVVNSDAVRNPESLDGIARALESAREADRTKTAASTVVGDDGAEMTAIVEQLWRDTLGPEADAEHTFSDLGGTSRQAMTLVREVRVVLGRDVHLETFLADPTLPGLLTSIRRAQRAVDAPPIVKLASGDDRFPPLFLIHDAWGDIDVYWPVAQLLTDSGPVFGVRTDLFGPDENRRTIAELAAIHAAAVQATAPEGPVRLGGHSFGGLVAFETAVLLSEAGRTVEVVALLDSIPPRRSLTSLHAALSRQANRLAMLLPGLRGESLRAMTRRSREPDTAVNDWDVFRTSSGIYHDHTWSTWNGPVIYFRARRRVPVIQHVLSAWRRAAPHLTVVDVPGNHNDLIGQKNVVETAVLFSAALASAARSDLEGRPEPSTADR